MPRNRFKVYSNSAILSTIHSMKSTDRMSHAFLIYGDKGLGKKNLSSYISSLIVCSSSTSAPCGECQNCKMSRNSAHPDIIWVQPSGKSGNYRVDDLRPVCVDAYVAPNSSDRKVYILADFDRTPALAQNVLLKIIEEPPEFAHFIFTAQSKESFLPTILSRLISFGIQRVSDDECKTALVERGLGDLGSVEDAVARFDGNLGKCIEYLSGTEIKQQVLLTMNIAKALVSGDEYELLTSLTPLEANKALAKSVFVLVSEVVRDASIVRVGEDNLISCDKDSAKKLAFKLSQKKIEKIFEFLQKASLNMDSNTGVTLTLTSLCANIKSVL